MPEQESQPYSELASFGEELRREREIRGISLKEIADATKISKRFLEAIERNDHRTLPAPVFTRGFIREYARYLGLNADDIVNRYNYAAAGDDRIEKSPHLERLAQRETKQGIPPPYKRIDRNVYVLVLIVAALAAVAYWAITHRHENRIAAEGGGATLKAAIPQTTTTAPLAAQEPMRMTVDVIGDSWVVLDADDKTVIDEEMHRGDRKTLEAKESFHFRTIGNAGGLKLTLNDLPMPALGRDGEVIHDKVIDRTSLKNP
jgi:transcriptional regulator with XRE-family HTH domain